MEGSWFQGVPYGLARIDERMVSLAAKESVYGLCKGLISGAIMQQGHGNHNWYYQTYIIGIIKG